MTSPTTAPKTTGNGTHASDGPPVPLLDLKAQYATLRDEIEPVIRKVVEDQWFILGPEVAALEQEIADYVGVKHAIGCASGSDAILLALMALDIGCGGGRNDRVICPSYTFFSTAGSIYRLGAFPVFADIDPATYNADIDHTRELARRVQNETGRLGALMPVHLFGQTVDMDAWLDLGAEFGVPVIEDAAQAIGSKDASGAMAGSRGRVGCFSFFPSKNLGGFGDGGMEPKYHHALVGVNGRLDAIQAAVLRVKLRHLEPWHADRQSNAARYDRQFAEAGARSSDVPFDDAVSESFPLRTPLPAEAPGRHIYNQYVIRVPAELRDPLRDHLKAHQIGNEVYYPIPLHLQECFSMLGYAAGDLPESERAAAETIALPVYPELTDEQQRRVVEVITRFLGDRASIGAVVQRSGL